MKRGIPALLLGLALCAGFTAHAARTGTVQPCAPSKPPEVHTFTGFITVHIECDRVLLEIPTVFSLIGNRAVTAGKWKAVTIHKRGAGIDKRPTDRLTSCIGAHRLVPDRTHRL